MHLLCLKMTCLQELFIAWRHVVFNTFMSLLISKFTFYESIMGIIIYLLPGWFKNWVISQWWMAHSFRRGTWPAGPFGGVCRCCAEICSWHSTCLANCSLLTVVSFAWWSSNGWAALWTLHVPSSDLFAPDPKIWDKSDATCLSFHL